MIQARKARERGWGWGWEINLPFLSSYYISLMVIAQTLIFITSYYIYF